MCLSIPSKVVSIDTENEMCTVDTMGVKREASLSMMKEGEVKIGDFVLIHIGFVMNTIDPKEAELSLETYKEILDFFDKEELENTIKNGDECVNKTI
jgi:hydrogenase expression/formation protein HypC